MRGSLQHTGALAQLGERLICIQEVRSSILLGSTITSGHQHDHQAHLWMSLIVLLDARDPRDRFTSFREIHISVMSVFPSGGGPAAHLALQDMRLSKSSTLTKMFRVPTRPEREKYNAFGSDCGAGETKGPALLDICEIVALK